jgi:inosine-uridine nucleoside N-ribohydrolase
MRLRPWRAHIKELVWVLAACLLLSGFAGCTGRSDVGPAPVEDRTPQPTSAAGAAAAPSETLRPLLVSTDMSSDDVAALLYLLSHPGFTVVGVTSANGVGHVAPSAQNVLRLLAAVGRSDVPVAVGADTPLAGSHSFPEAWRSAADRLFGLDAPPAASEVRPGTAAELMAESIRAYPHQLTIMLLGAHTDLAVALRADPTLAGEIGRVHIMGGAVRVPGNIHAEFSRLDNESAEWNIWLDYRAAAEVFACGAPLSLVPLDATNSVRVDRQSSEAFAQDSLEAAGRLVADLWQGQASSGEFYIWDVVAAVALTSPEAAVWERLGLGVETSDASQLGRTWESADGGASVQVCLRMETEVVLETLRKVFQN